MVLAELLFAAVGVASLTKTGKGSLLAGVYMSLCSRKCGLVPSISPIPCVEEFGEVY